MQVFNVGVLEFLFILVLAFIVLGPKKAIKAAGDVGRFVKKLTTSSFWREIITTSSTIREFPKKLMNDIEIQKTIEDLDRSTKEINQVFQQTRRETKDKLVNLQQNINHEIHKEPGKGNEVTEASSSDVFE